VIAALVRRVRLSLAPGEGQWLGAGYLLALSSSFGQTFFIALSGGEIRALLDLSPGDFGGLYGIATGLSALTMIWVGQLADRRLLAPLAMAVLGMLAVACLLMATAETVLQLLLALYLLRLFGQGMSGHVSVTAMARWFEVRRGRALSIAALGYPTGEALLPSLTVLAAALAGWRGVWFLAAGLLLLVSLPLVRWLLRHEPGRTPPAAAPSPTASDRPSWTRRQVLRDPLLYLLLPGILIPSFTMTGIFFHQTLLVEAKGWSLAWFAACFPVYAATVVIVSLVTGWTLDRYGSRVLLSLYLLPLTLAFALLSAGDWPGLAPAFMLLAGATVGQSFVLLGALWAELYGTAHIGAIRALVHAAMVLSTAAAPGLMGWLFDLGVGLDAQLQVFALYTLAACVLFCLRLLRHPRLARN